MKILGVDKMRVQLVLAYIGENLAGGYYHQLSQNYTDQPELAKRLRKTAGDEIRHGGYFSACHAEHYGSALGLRDTLINAGRVAARLQHQIPQLLFSQRARFNLITKGEQAAVDLLEQQLAESAPSPYFEVVQRILPDEHAHAVPYQV